jgi:hypothetical protein
MKFLIDDRRIDTDLIRTCRNFGIDLGPSSRQAARVISDSDRCDASIFIGSIAVSEPSLGFLGS